MISISLPSELMSHIEPRNTLVGTLVGTDRGPQIGLMGARIFDFSHLTPAERIELAEQLWNSLELEPEVLDEGLMKDLRQRRKELRADGHLGADGDRVLDEIATRER